MSDAKFRCRYLGDLPSARDCFKASVRMRPDYADATNWLIRVEAKLQGDTFTATAAASTSVTVQ